MAAAEPKTVEKTTTRGGPKKPSQIKGLFEGLWVTLRALTSRSQVVQYPHVKEEPHQRARGVIGLLEENCTVCMLCARECPDWCIYIEGHKERREPRREGGKPRTVQVLDRFDIDFALCMYCGICVEVCPFDALHWSPEYEYSELEIRDLIHDKDRLGYWDTTKPPAPRLGYYKAAK
ncbi:MAG: NADH-quinone oxidoreductase subunit I [Acidimicrobiia bacterium]|nr:NADH-quinone oxidoreductase subunit I [Acidimicrobiia bacterium]